MNALTNVHPNVVAARERFHGALVTEVSTAANTEPVLVVGMAWNPHVKKARTTLDAKGVKYKYLEYGNYLSGWRERLALKMWAGWPTFPMVFVKGQLVGGASDLKKLDETGELEKLLK